MRRDAAKIAIRREHRQIVAHTKLREKRIDGADRRAGAPTSVAQFCRVNVVLSVRDDERQGGEAVEYLRPCPGPRESLQQLLQDQSGRQDDILALQGAPQRVDFGRLRRAIPAERQRPYARVDEEAQSRLRARL